MAGAAEEARQHPEARQRKQHREHKERSQLKHHRNKERRRHKEAEAVEARAAAARETVRRQPAAVPDVLGSRRRSCR